MGVLPLNIAGALAHPAHKGAAHAVDGRIHVGVDSAVAVGVSPGEYGNSVGAEGHNGDHALGGAGIGNEIFDKRLGRSLGIFNIFAVHAVGHVNGDNHRRIGGGGDHLGLGRRGDLQGDFKLILARERLNILFQCDRAVIRGGNGRRGALTHHVPVLIQLIIGANLVFAGRQRAHGQQAQNHAEREDYCKNFFSFFSQHFHSPFKFERMEVGGWTGLAGVPAVAS